MEKAAIIHNPDNYFFYSTKKDTFTVKLMVKAGDVDGVVLHYSDKYIPLDKLDTRAQTSMHRVAGDGIYDYFEAEIKVNMLCIRYYFEIRDMEGEITYYGNYAFHKTEPTVIEEMFDCPQLSREEERYEAPAWAKGKVVYQIFVDRFASDKDVPAEEWYRQDLNHRDSLHGSLKGITQSIPYLKNLGVDVLYLTPIFKANSSHKYDTVDYMQIDPDFGTAEDLKNLTSAAHEAGIYIVLDAVFNHTSRDFFAFRDLQEKQQNSRYKDWYYVDEYPARGELMPTYRSFSYFGGMPKLNCRNPEVRKFVCDVVKYWTEECHVDGWRLDVADEIGRDFWREFRKEMREVNPRLFIVGEIWHFNGSYLTGDQWDSVMNYHFTDAVKGFLLEKKLTAKEFAEKLDFVRGRLKGEAVPYLWNLIDSHDTPRFLTQADGKKEILKLAAALQLLLPGMPMIYYGDEVGMTGGKGSGCRRGMLWDEERQDRELLGFYRKLLAVRRQNPVIGEGEVCWLNEPEESTLLSWCFCGEGGRKVTVLLNNGDKAIRRDELAGRKELLSGMAFDGIIQAYSVYIF